MLTRAIERFRIVVRDEGLFSAIRKMASALRRTPQPATADVFDSTLQTDTSAQAHLWRLKIPSENARFGNKYQTAEPSVFLNVLGKVPADYTDFVFIDLGCGKGRTLILATQQGFKRVIGVEFSPELAIIARSNLERVGVAVEILEMDASQFVFPDDNLVIYLYNPFGGPVMDAVVRNLRAWAKQSGKTAFVAYVNPTCGKAYDSVPAFEPVVHEATFSIWRLQERAHSAGI